MSCNWAHQTRKTHNYPDQGIAVLQYSFTPDALQLGASGP
jgi:hypothetical protein